jgi:uncharacterized protein (TIGR02453 family)
MKQVYEFLKELELNNNRVWFNDNKSRYLEAKAIYETFVAEVIEGLGKIDPEIINVQVKQSVFQIYKDTRFSHDKSPYKTHMGAFISKGGKQSARGGYYVHVQPGRSLLSGGLWCPDKEILKVLRQDVFDNAEEFKAILNNPGFSKYFSLDNDPDKLKKVPAPFPKDSPDAEYVKYKRYTATSIVEDDFFTGPDVAFKTIDRLKLLMPLNSFLNYAVDNR